MGGGDRRRRVGGGRRPGAGRLILLIAAHAFAAGCWAGRRSGVAGLLALLVASQVAVAVEHESFVPFIFVVATPWLLGRALREHALVAARLAERARQLDEEAEAHARLSVRYERAGVASELHDIVGHAITVMVVQAGAGQRLAATDPALAGEAFAAIGAAARQAEEDTGRLVALLGDDDASGRAPDLALVEELVTRAAGTGLDVSLRLSGDYDSSTPAVAQTAYRIVQESLTNALRYAPGSAVAVLVRGRGEALELEIVNGPARQRVSPAEQGGGTGLRGLRDRLWTCGGRLEAGPTDEGGWRVAAHVPRRAISTGGVGAR